MNTVADSFGLALGLVLGGDAELWRIVALSLRVSVAACAIGGVVGLSVGAALAVARFRGQGVVVGVLNTLLALPSVVVGLAVYLLLSRAGPLGSLGILFTPAAMVVAQSVLVVPLIAALSRRLVLDALAEGGEQLQSLGAGRAARAVLTLVHGRVGVLTIGLAAFGRAIAEVGAVMIVGGNIAGVTRVMTTAIALETSKGDLALALALGLVLLGVVAAVNLLIAALPAPGRPWPGWRAASAGAGGGAEVAGSPARDAMATPAAMRDRPVGDPPLPLAHALSPQLPTPLPPPLQPDTSHPAFAAAAPGAPLLALHGVSVRHGLVMALQNVDLVVRRGERVVLVGANGSGKTTLLRAMHGLLHGEGRCERLPAVPGGPLPVAAMLFQRPFLLNLSVRRNVRVALALRRVPREHAEARCDDALARVGLSELAARPARSLSGGQQQRLALARAWALRPEILFLDEPTASLDPGATREIESLIDRVAGAGVTLVMSTHNLGQARRLGSRVILLDTGRIAVDLPVEAFFGSELPETAASFVRGELPWR